tara:strand:+ start:2683 stop:3480 length:798 start_codon:yes stop_codon:yes gene_type:complete
MIIELSEFFNNPSIIDVGFIKIQYYAITWLLSALLIYQFLKKDSNLIKSGLNEEKINDMVFLYGLFFGAICGGRIGYMFFYGLDQLYENPLSVFYVWQGGLSFHGGLVGVIISLIIFCKKNNIEFLNTMDSIALAMPIGLGLVRIGNFLNGELFGRPTDQSWGFIFPTDSFGLMRHPSQLYESFGEGILLFIILFLINKKTRTSGIISGSFLIFYSLIRFVIEFYRQPDNHIGFVLYDYLSMGQLLCIPMFIFGFLIIFYSYRKI